MGSFESKSTSTKSQIKVKGKESQQKKLKPLNVKQSSSESASHSKMDPINDLKMKQTGSWISRQESKRSRDFMKFSQTKLGKKKNELSTHEKQEKLTIMRRQRDKSLKEELSRRIEIPNPMKAKPELKEHSLQDTVGTAKSKERANQNLDMDKDNDDNLNKTKEQCMMDTGN